MELEGEEKELRCQIRDDELNRFFEEHDTERDKKPWMTDRWEEARAEVLKDCCQWCGSEEELSIHHKNHGDTAWWEIWDKVRDQLFNNSEYIDNLETPTAECCPECKKQNIYERTTMSPTYRCTPCGATFEEPSTKPLNKRRNTDYWKKMDEFVEENAESITEEFAEVYEQHWESYFEMEDTVTICKKCHYMWHENNKKICVRCRDSYAKRRGSGYICWDCVVERKGLEKCPECEEDWYNPEYKDACKSCRRPY